MAKIERKKSPHTSTEYLIIDGEYWVHQSDTLFFKAYQSLHVFGKGSKVFTDKTGHHWMRVLNPDYFLKILKKPLAEKELSTCMHCNSPEADAAWKRRVDRINADKAAKKAAKDKEFEDWKQLQKNRGR
jgi:hypothetical protein